MLFIESTDDESMDFQNFINYIKYQKLNLDREELEHILQLISNISNNYNRQTRLFNKIEQILLFFENEIKQTFTNLEIFNIFQSNKWIILFLVKKNILSIEDLISNYEFQFKDKENYLKNQYFFFFLPDAKTLLGNEIINEIEVNLTNDDPNILQNYEEKRQIGENESYICNLIRNDSIDEFITYVNQANIPLSSYIKPSIYETNQFLIEQEPTLIEYATFFGSIQIFQFLKYSEVKLTPSLWKYAIHSQNAELIHILEENHVIPDDKTFYEILKEAIKCHHNDIAKYIEENLLIKDDKDSNANEDFIECCFCYTNYLYIPRDYNQSIVLFSLYHYRHYKIFNLIMKNKRNEIESKIILQLC